MFKRYQFDSSKNDFIVFETFKQSNSKFQFAKCFLFLFKKTQYFQLLVHALYLIGLLRTELESFNGLKIKMRYFLVVRQSGQKVSFYFVCSFSLSLNSLQIKYWLCPKFVFFAFSLKSVGLDWMKVGGVRNNLSGKSVQHR